MMHKVLATAVILSPMLLHAQAAPLAQPASPPVPLKISSGIAAPKLIQTFPIYWSGDPIWLGKTAIVHMYVDPTGKPTDLKIVRSMGPEVDQDILESVSRYRFTPGTLDNQPTTIPLTLEITLLRPDAQ